VTRPGEPADNEAWPALRDYSPRGQVWITRLGAYTRVVLVAEESEAEAPPAVSTRSWA
jgi:hypothetical protein